MEGARPPVCSNASRTLTRALSLPASENPCIFTTAQHSLLYSANRSESARVPRLAVEACSFMLCDLDFEPLSLSLSSLPSCDLMSLTNMLILLHYLESFKSELAEITPRTLPMLKTSQCSFVSLTSSLQVYHQGTVSLQKCFSEYQGIPGLDQSLKTAVVSKPGILWIPESHVNESAIALIIVLWFTTILTHAVATASAQNDNGSLEAESIVRVPASISVTVPSFDIAVLFRGSRSGKFYVQLPSSLEI
ncbi:hypothetical protein Tco_0408455 [Tanacetum coccineum]